MSERELTNRRRCEGYRCVTGVSFFFFQAEDGIRDLTVTGVQTCALPIFLWQLEVEGKTPAEVAPMFGLSGNGASALAMRAREGLRQAYLQEHIGTNIPVQDRKSVV